MGGRSMSPCILASASPRPHRGHEKRDCTAGQGRFRRASMAAALFLTWLFSWCSANLRYRPANADLRSCRAVAG